jgi:hypothetical protein
VRDIVERLRARHGFFRNGAAWIMGTSIDQDCAEAAAEIERLRAEIERANSPVVDCRNNAESYHDPKYGLIND